MTIATTIPSSIASSTAIAIVAPAGGVLEQGIEVQEHVLVQLVNRRHVTVKHEHVAGGAGKVAMREQRLEELDPRGDALGHLADHIAVLAEMALEPGNPGADVARLLIIATGGVAGHVRDPHELAIFGVPLNRIDGIGVRIAHERGAVAGQGQRASGLLAVAVVVVPKANGEAVAAIATGPLPPLVAPSGIAWMPSKRNAFFDAPETPESSTL